MSQGGAIAARLYALFLTDPLLLVTITAPTSGATVTTASPTVSWTFEPGPQVTYRVIVYADSAGTTIVYDSGILASGSKSHVIPAGILDNSTTYYLLVQTSSASGQAGESPQPHSFTTDIAPQGAAPTLTATPEGGKCETDQTELPLIRLAWSAYEEQSGETLLGYDVLKRTIGASAWVRIANMDGTTPVRSFVDAQVAPSQTYEYAVRAVVEDASANVLYTPVQSDVTAMVETDFTFLHLVGHGDAGCEDETAPTSAQLRQAAAYRRFVRFDGWSPDTNVDTDLRIEPTWGREKPVGFAGEKLAATFQLPGHAHRLDDTTYWSAILDLLEGQRDLPSVVCLRFGRARQMYYVLIDQPRRADSQRQYTPSMRAIEVDWDESDWYCEWGA